MHRLKTVLLTAGYVVLAAVLSSCAQSGIPETQTAVPTALPTSTPIPTTLYTRTPIPLATLSFFSLTPTTAPVAGHIMTVPGEQAYIDPSGWFAVKFPAGWKQTDKAISFEGPDGFFEVGYLPDLGFVSSGINVCVWLANMYPPPDQKAIWISSGGAQKCSLVPLGPERIHTLEIYENPEADYDRRFLYYKGGTGGQIPVTFWTLQPLSEKAPRFDLMSSRPEDVSFWEGIRSGFSKFSVKEYILPPEAQAEGPGEAILANFVPPELLYSKAGSSTNLSPEKPTVEEQLRPLGYELRKVEENGFQRTELYKDGKVLFNNVFHVSDVYTYTTDSGTLTAFVVDAVKEATDTGLNSYLIQNDVIVERGYNINDPPFAPALYQGELLWARAAKEAHVEVQKRNGEVVFSFATYFGTHLPINMFKGWKDHWILEVGDFIIQDGEILNEKFDFEEVFYWHLIKDKPTYFFRKGPRIGLSYGGQFFALNYQDVRRGYCCGFAADNPRIIDNTLRFFGKRAGVWYYVIVTFH